MIDILYRIIGAIPEGAPVAIVDGAIALIIILTVVFVDRIFQIFDTFKRR